MKITTWNVNGLRARLTHVVDFVREHRPDVLCLQETKVQDEQFPREPLEDEGYNVVISGQQTYNGVAVLSKRRIENVSRGFPYPEHEDDKRLIACVVGDLMLLDVYVPNGQMVGSVKYAYKLHWLEQLRRYLDERYSHTEKIVVAQRVSSHARSRRSQSSLNRYLSAPTAWPLGT